MFKAIRQLSIFQLKNIIRICDTVVARKIEAECNTTFEYIKEKEFNRLYTCTN
jgi:hypothetical protein